MSLSKERNTKEVSPSRKKTRELSFFFKEILVITCNLKDVELLEIEVSFLVTLRRLRSKKTLPQ